ncbi:MAG: type I 3-dehydroquinate dehydratase [Clostridia bacterium]|jgi:3-dehydroquinate dehydratase-1
MNIVVSFADNTYTETIHAAKKFGMNFAELRIDLFTFIDVDRVIHERNKFDVPIIGTIRSKKENGNWKKSEKNRLSLFEKIMPHIDIVDIELDSEKINTEVIKCARNHGKSVMISFHDFEKTPDVNTVVWDAIGLGADIVKIATKVSKEYDIRVLAKLLSDFSDIKLAIIGMGDFGLMTRIFFPALGSFMTFASAGIPTAPGQIHMQDMYEQLKRYYR